VAGVCHARQRTGSPYRQRAPQPQPLTRRVGSGAGLSVTRGAAVAGSAVPTSPQQQELVCVTGGVACSRRVDLEVSIFVILSWAFDPVDAAKGEALQAMRR
jgi:hypothetical protein